MWHQAYKQQTLSSPTLYCSNSNMHLGDNYCFLFSNIFLSVPKFSFIVCISSILYIYRPWGPLNPPSPTSLCAPAWPRGLDVYLTRALYKAWHPLCRRAPALKSLFRMWKDFFEYTIFPAFLLLYLVGKNPTFSALETRQKGYTFCRE